MNSAAPDTTDATELVITRQFSAPPGQLFGAWTEPDIIAQWMGPKGVDTRVDTHDFRVGGLFRFVLAGGESEHVARGTFLTIDPPRRLVFTWSWEEGVYADIETEIEVEFEATGEGTMLTLTQRRFTSDEMRDDHDRGWTDGLDELADFLASQRPRVHNPVRDVVNDAFLDPAESMMTPRTARATFVDATFMELHT